MGETYGQPAAPRITGVHTAAVEIVNIVAMTAHAHQSLSAGCVAVTAAGSLRAARRSFATAFLLGRDNLREQVGLSRSACIPEMGDLSGECGESNGSWKVPTKPWG